MTSAEPRIVRLVGDFDLTRLHAVEALLSEADPGEDIVVDLGAVTFVDSVTLSAFVRASRRHEAAGSRLVLADAYAAVRRVLAITQLDRLMSYADTVDDAVAMLRNTNPDNPNPASEE